MSCRSLPSAIIASSPPTRLQPTFEQEVVLDTVAAVNAELSRSLFRGKDFEVCAEAGDPNDALAGLVGTYTSV